MKICPSCKYIFGDERENCSACGHSLEKYIPPPNIESTTHTQTIESGKAVLPQNKVENNEQLIPTVNAGNNNTEGIEQKEPPRTERNQLQAGELPLEHFIHAPRAKMKWQNIRTSLKEDLRSRMFWMTVGGLLLALLSSIPIIVGWYKRLGYMPPTASILVNDQVVQSDEIKACEKEHLNLCVDVSPRNEKLDYRWVVNNRVRGGEDECLDLVATISQRYDLTNVVLQAKDKFGYQLPSQPSLKIRVTPDSQCNHNPSIEEKMHTIPERLEIFAGESVTLEALATDEDKDDIKNLKYKWRIDGDAAKIIDNDKRRVTVEIPPALAKYGSVSMGIHLVVKDGHEGGVGDNNKDDEILTVHPLPKPRARRGKPAAQKYAVDLHPTTQAPAGSKNGAPLPAPTARPEVPPTKQTPQETEKPRQPRAAPTKQLATKDGG